jgi:hypothetical protein
MAITRWKMAALALFASGLLASGALVSAQQSQESASTRAEPDRLRAVEEKLDRLLKKFDDAGARLAPAPVAITPGMSGALTAAPRGFEESPRSGRDPFGRNPGATTANTPLVPATAAEPPPQYGYSPYAVAGNKGLEQRVAALEFRLAKVEHMLADLLDANRARATTPEGGGRPNRPKDDLPLDNRRY